MSVPPRRRLPERPSLEQLRKQAREHLDTLRAADPSVNLAAAQHASRASTVSRVGRSWYTTSNCMQPANRMVQPAELKSDQKLLWSPGRRERRSIRPSSMGTMTSRSSFSSAAPFRPAVESSGDSALWVAQERRPDKRMEQLLLSYGATPTKRDPGEDWPTRAHNWLRISPLHEAARKGDLLEAKKLLEAGADLRARDEHLRSTPLAWAAKYGQLEMVKFLLQHGAPKSLPDDPEWATPLAWATKRGHDEIARLLS